MKNNEFHVPFIQSLVIVALVTVFTMTFAHYYVPRLYNSYQDSQQYTSVPSQFSPDH